MWLRPSCRGGGKNRSHYLLHRNYLHSCELHHYITVKVPHVLQGRNTSY